MSLFSWLSELDCPKLCVCTNNVQKKGLFNKPVAVAGGYIVSSFTRLSRFSTRKFMSLHVFHMEKADPLFRVVSQQKTPALSHPSDPQPILGQMIIGRVHAPSFHLQAQFNRKEKKHDVNETHTLFQDKIFSIYLCTYDMLQNPGVSYMKYLYYFNILWIWLPPPHCRGWARSSYHCRARCTKECWYDTCMFFFFERQKDTNVALEDISN